MSLRNALFLIALSALVAGLCFAEDITIAEKIGGFRNTQACAVHGGVLYLLDYYYLISFDPATGDFLDTLDLGEYARNIAFADDKAVVVGIAEAHLIDIADPTDMVDLDDVNFGGISGWDVDIEGDLAFLAVQSRMAVYRIVGGSLVAAGSYIPSTPFPMVRSVAVEDATLYVGFGDMGIAALDVTTPSMPVLLMSADTPGHTIDLQIAGDRLVCADGAYIGSPAAIAVAASSSGIGLPLLMAKAVSVRSIFPRRPARSSLLIARRATTSPMSASAAIRSSRRARTPSIS